KGRMLCWAGLLVAVPFFSAGRPLTLAGSFSCAASSAEKSSSSVLPFSIWLSSVITKWPPSTPGDFFTGQERGPSKDWSGLRAFRSYTSVTHLIPPLPSLSAKRRIYPRSFSSLIMRCVFFLPAGDRLIRSFVRTAQSFGLLRRYPSIPRASQL